MEKLYQKFIKENNLSNLTRNQANFIKGFLGLNTFGTTDKEIVAKLFEFKKENDNG